MTKHQPLDAIAGDDASSIVKDSLSELQIVVEQQSGSPDVLLALVGESGRDRLAKTISDTLGVPTLLVKLVLIPLEAMARSLVSAGANSVRDRLVHRVVGILARRPMVGGALKKVGDHLTRLLRDPIAMKRIADQIREAGAKPTLSIDELDKELGDAVTITLRQYFKTEEIAETVRRLHYNPVLSMRIPPELPGDKPAFDFRLEAGETKVVGCQEDLSFLQSFADRGEPILWQLLYGPAGAGKSRIAQEFCLRIYGEWDCGFLDDHPIRLKETQWVPQRDTLFVVDDITVEKAEALQSTIIDLYERQRMAPYPYKLRFLLLERRRDGDWFDEFYRPHLRSGLYLSALQHDSPREMSALDPSELADLAAQVFYRGHTRLVEFGHHRAAVEAVFAQDEEMARPPDGDVGGVRCGQRCSCAQA